MYDITIATLTTKLIMIYMFNKWEKPPATASGSSARKVKIWKVKTVINEIWKISMGKYI